MGEDVRHKPKQKIFSKPRSDPSSIRRPEAPPQVMYDKKRQLNSYELKAPYQIKPQYLIEDHVEKRVQFVGEIDGVSPHLDITNRTDVLRIIDKGKKQGVIPLHVSHENDAILSLSVFNIKISKYNATEDLLLRIHMHEIAAICYIKDDQQHILAVKFGTTESCKLAILYCEHKPAAEEICALIGQCFNLVYTEATVYLIERQLSPTDRPGSTSSGSTLVHRPDILSYNTASLHNYPMHSDTESGKNSISDISTGKELLEDYMAKLTSKLNADELRKFLQHLNDWKRDNHFHEFCDDVLLLLGPARKQLLSELLPFIPSDNYQYFEEFLRRNDIRLLGTSSTLSSSRTNLRDYPTRRSLSEVSTTSSVSNSATAGDTIDHFSEVINAQFNSVEVDMDPKTYVPSEDY